MDNYSLQQIKAAYTQKEDWEKQFPINYFFVRPFSFYLTYLVLKVTRDPAKMAIFGFSLGVIGCFFLATASLFSLWPGILFIALYSISDAADGNIARTTHNVTLFGKYLDGLLGELIDGSYFFFLGVGLYFSWDGSKDPIISPLLRTHVQIIPLILGALALICRLWATHFRNVYEIYRVRKEGLEPVDDSKVKNIIGKSRYHDRWYFLILINLESLNTQLLLLVLLAALGFEIWFLVFFACFFVGRALVYFIFYFAKTKSRLTKSPRNF
jgi:phosphatidylglycerophosphate synthase